uniref:5_nucleotid_C domain-containing protein n=1 Tax=Macrostomum lignano TaxID=282301 RepID=A0A1I8FNC3_9PLAT
QLHILHFNDVYNIEPAGHIGGAARFVTRAARSFASSNLWLLFSGARVQPVDYQHGDPRPASGPGAQSLPTSTPRVLAITTSTLAWTIWCSAARRPDFPGCCPNIIDRETGRPLAEGLETVCIDHRASGLRIGIVGLVELEWVDTLSTVDPEDIRFFDFCTRGEQLAAKLKSEQSCDLEAGPAAHHIDIILGGHDHNYGIEFVNNRAIVKSGTDFRQFSVVSLSIDKSSPLEVKIQTVDVDSSKYSEDPEVAKAVESHVENLEKSMQRVLGQVDCPWSAGSSTFAPRRPTWETSCATSCSPRCRRDFVLVNSGSFRADCVVSGLRFRFDGTRPPGSRVDPSSVQIGDKPMVADTQYRMATKYYLYCGKDGYDMLPGCQLLVDDEDGPNYFTASGVLRGWLQLKEPAPLPPAANEPSTVLRGGQPAGDGAGNCRATADQAVPAEKKSARELGHCAPGVRAPAPRQNPIRLMRSRLLRRRGRAWRAALWRPPGWRPGRETGRGDEEDQREAGE